MLATRQNVAPRCRDDGGAEYGATFWLVGVSNLDVSEQGFEKLPTRFQGSPPLSHSRGIVAARFTPYFRRGPIPMTPEDRARENIDRQLAAAGWAVQDMRDLNLYASRGVAVREFRLVSGPVDYLLLVDRRAVGVIEAKREGTTLTEVEPQATRYGEGLQGVPAPVNPLPFQYVSTGAETRFTSLLDPEPRS